jgi:hypothetical protein
LPDLPAAEGFVPVMAPYVRSDVADPGLAKRSTPIGVELGNRVVKDDAAAHRGGVRKHIGRIAEFQLLTKPGRDFVAVDWGVSGG